MTESRIKSIIAAGLSFVALSIPGFADAITAAGGDQAILAAFASVWVVAVTGSSTTSTARPAAAERRASDGQVLQVVGLRRDRGRGRRRRAGARHRPVRRGA